MVKKKYLESTAFLDLLFNLVLGLVFLFAVSFVMIAPNESKVQANAEFLITITWDKESDDDVDLWICDPNGRIAWFRDKDKKSVYIDRDDRGRKADTIMTVNGEILVCPYNQEIATIRGIVKGEWIINVHLYAKRDTKRTDVEVKIEKLNPSVILVHYEVVSLENKGDELTVIRFVIDDNGNIVSKEKMFVSLVSKFLADSREIQSYGI